MFRIYPEHGFPIRGKKRCHGKGENSAASPCIAGKRAQINENFPFSSERQGQTDDASDCFYSGHNRFYRFLALSAHLQSADGGRMASAGGAAENHLRFHGSAVGTTELLFVAAEQ